MNAPGAMPRWPKGPFPERYRFGAVQSRLEGAWTAPRERALARIVHDEDLRATGPIDPWVRVLSAPRALEPSDHERLRRCARDEDLVLFGWIPAGRERRGGELAHEAVGVVPTADVVDAVSAVGVAGPTQGIGMPAVVRFLVTLRSFGRYDVAAMGEDAIELTLEPRDEDALARIAERVVRICPPLARRPAGAEAVAADVRARGRLAMDWA